MTYRCTLNHKKQSAYGKAIMLFRKRQALLANPYTGEDLHPDLICLVDDPDPVINKPRGMCPLKWELIKDKYKRGRL